MINKEKIHEANLLLNTAAKLKEQRDEILIADRVSIVQGKAAINETANSSSTRIKTITLSEGFHADTFEGNLRKYAGEFKDEVINLYDKEIDRILKELDKLNEKDIKANPDIAVGDELS